MNGELNSPLDIWDLYNLSTPAEFNQWAEMLGFRPAHQDDDMFLCVGKHAVVSVLFGNGISKRVTYKPKDKLSFNSFTGWVTDNMDFEEVFHNVDESADVMRLDNCDFTLFYMYLTQAPEMLAYDITLRAKLAPYDPNNRIEVAIATPPPINS